MRPLRIVLIAAAAAAALLPVPAWMVEQVYSRGAYLRLQPVLTGASNLVPVALLDLAVATLLVLFTIGFVKGVRRRGWPAAARRGLGWLVTAAAVIYLLFLAAWGLNYRRVPLEDRLAFDRGRIDRAAAIALASKAAGEINAGHAAAHAAPFEEARLHRSLAAVQRTLGLPRAARPADAKPSLAQLHFRQAAIDGMTVPWFLEVILHPDLLPVEIPHVLAHEQAHVAGFADESEASFVAWLACVRSDDPVARYSGWLDIYRLASGAVGREAREGLPPLDPGPREDLRQIAARLRRSSPRIRQASREVYDSYLKANRIEEGIANYGRVLQLVLGTRFDDGWTPVLR